jgi:hypothetical protein
MDESHNIGIGPPEYLRPAISFILFLARLHFLCIAAADEFLAAENGLGLDALVTDSRPTSRHGVDLQLVDSLCFLGNG